MSFLLYCLHNEYYRHIIQSFIKKIKRKTIIKQSKVRSEEHINQKVNSVKVRVLGES